MAIRTPIAFQTAFDQACRACGYTRTQIDANATLKAEFLQLFNRTYQIGYELPAKGWEDARVGATVEPVDQYITWDVIGEAHEYDVWEEDPRDVDGSTRLAFTTDYAGIRLLGEFDSVWVTWIPLTAEFDSTAWVTATAYVVGDVRLYTTNGNCYRCLVAHTSGTFATDLASSYWVLMPVLAVLREFIIAHMLGTRELERGKPQTGKAMQDIALERLDDDVRKELIRNTRGGVAESTGNSSGAVTSSSNYLRWLSAVTGLTGGGSANLDGIVTTSYTAGTQLVCFAINAEFQVWQLQAVSTAENASGGIVRPDDYDATSNLKTWIRIL